MGANMDISTDRNRTKEIKSNRYAVALQGMRNAIRWLAGIFTFTEADRTKAGIYIRRPGA
jgi:hypothetical protein